MNNLEKSYNKHKKLYRWEKKPIGNGKWKKQFEKEWVILELEKHGFKTNIFEFRIKPYRPYFLWRLWWSIKRFIFLAIINPIKQLIQKPMRELTIGVLAIIIAYVLMKFIIGWNV